MMRGMLGIALVVALLGALQPSTRAQQPVAPKSDCTGTPLAMAPGSNGPNPFVGPCKVGPPLEPAGSGAAPALVNQGSATAWLTGWPPNVHVNDLVAAYDQATRRRKLLFVIFGADWCNYCKAMKGESFSNPRIVTLLSENVMVVLDVEKDDRHDNTKRLMDRLAIREFPAFALMQIDGPNPGVIGRVIGYHDTAQFYNALFQLHPEELTRGKERPGPAPGKGAPLPPAGTPAR